MLLKLLTSLEQKNSYAVIENPKLRVAYQKRQLAINQHEISGLGYLATEAAYRYGKDWLEELKQVFEDHINYVVDLFGKETKNQGHEAARNLLDLA